MTQIRSFTPLSFSTEDANAFVQADDSERIKILKRLGVSSNYINVLTGAFNNLPAILRNSAGLEAAVALFNGDMAKRWSTAEAPARAFLAQGDPNFAAQEGPPSFSGNPKELLAHRKGLLESSLGLSFDFPSDFDAEAQLHLLDIINPAERKIGEEQRHLFMTFKGDSDAIYQKCGLTGQLAALPSIFQNDRFQEKLQGAWLRNNYCYDEGSASFFVRHFNQRATQPGFNRETTLKHNLRVCNFSLTLRAFFTHKL